jgi:hypothetical protein
MVSSIPIPRSAAVVSRLRVKNVWAMATAIAKMECDAQNSGFVHPTQIGGKQQRTQAEDVSGFGV